MDLRERGVSADEQGGAPLAEIASRVSVGHPLRKQRLGQKREAGSLARGPQRAAANKRGAISQRQWGARPIATRPAATLAELQGRVVAEKQITVRVATVCRTWPALRVPRERRP